MSKTKNTLPETKKQYEYQSFEFKKLKAIQTSMFYFFCFKKWKSIEIAMVLIRTNPPRSRKDLAECLIPSVAVSSKIYEEEGPGQPAPNKEIA